MCDCIRVSIDADGGVVSLQLQSAGEYNGQPYWTYNYGGAEYFIYFLGGSCWVLDTALGGGTFLSRHCPGTDLCVEAFMSPDTPSNNPVTMWNFIFNAPSPMTNVKEFTTIGIDCPTCNDEDRTKQTFQSIKLPTTFQEENRGGLKECCCKYLVLADSSGDSWKNDKTSAWIKTSDASDTFSFRLYKDGVLASYTPTSNQFVNDANAYYTTIDWSDVLASDGQGCYELKIGYNISGISGTLTWGVYTLHTYSIQNALRTARIRAKFNSNQEIEGINFTGSEVESTFRFFGFIGYRKPNMETDNIIYNNREMKSVIRENLNQYEICTDPSDECITRPLIDLFLLSENELYISDYNQHNHSYRYQDLPVIVEESPEVEYFDLSRKAKVTCIVSDKFKNKRTYY